MLFIEGKHGRLYNSLFSQKKIPFSVIYIWRHVLMYSTRKETADLEHKLFPKNL